MNKIVNARHILRNRKPETRAKENINSLRGKPSRLPIGFRDGGEENPALRFRRDLIPTCGFLTEMQGGDRFLKAARE